MLGTFRVGEDISVALDAARGDVADVASIEAKMTQAYREGGPLKGAPIALNVTEHAPEGDSPAGWLLSLAASSTASLAPGIYALDAKIVLVAGGTELTMRTAYISLTRSAFG